MLLQIRIWLFEEFATSSLQSEERVTGITMLDWPAQKIHIANKNVLQLHSLFSISNFENLRGGVGFHRLEVDFPVLIHHFGGYDLPIEINSHFVGFTLPPDSHVLVAL